jgi:hypothetical protein
VILIDCAREAEVLRAVEGGRFDWDRPGNESDDVDELRAHAESCEICRDVVVVASLFREDRDLARHDVRVPAAGQVWWRAAVRARLDGAQAAARPLMWAQGVAGACAVGVAAGGAGLAWPAIADAIAWMRAVAGSPAAFAVTDLVSTAVQRSLSFALVAAASLVLAPLALYLALSDE